MGILLRVNGDFDLIVLKDKKEISETEYKTVLEKLSNSELVLSVNSKEILEVSTMKPVYTVALDVQDCTEYEYSEKEEF